MSDIPEELNLLVTQGLRDQGIEMTPDQVRAERKKVYAAIRAHLRAKGITPPESDMELLEWMSLAGLGPD